MNNIAFHIGHHKTATTWLQMKYFDIHPQIHLVSNYLAPWDDPFLCYLIGTSERKFDENICIDKFYPVDSSHSVNCVKVVSAERLSGHPFSGGYDSYLIAERINRCFPDSKIIIVIRNQVDMLISMYHQLVREGYRGTFKDLIYSKQWKGTSFSLDFLEYDLLVRKYQKLFTEDRVLVLVYEDMKVDQAMYVNRISEFLGVECFHGGAEYDCKINESLRLNHIRAIRLANHFKKSEFNPFPIVSMSGKSLDFVSKTLSLFLSSSGLIDDVDKAFIQRYYAESNSRLGTVLDRELPWCC